MIQTLIYGLSNSAISDDLEWPSRLFTYCEPFQMQFFVNIAQRLTRFLLT